MNITILTLGKLKESWWKEAEKEYIKRISPYAKISFIELKEEAFRKGDSKELIKQKEAEKILPYLPRYDFCIALHERSKEFTSKEFSKYLYKQNSSGSHILFIIGGPLGLDHEILEKTHAQISLSPLTFPHQMVRTILLEQIYRAITIEKEKSYHY